MYMGGGVRESIPTPMVSAISRLSNISAKNVTYRNDVREGSNVATIKTAFQVQRYLQSNTSPQSTNKSAWLQAKFGMETKRHLTNELIKTAT